MMKIPLTQGKFVLIDDEDYPLVVGYRWFLQKTPRSQYAYAHKTKNGVRKWVEMHRLIIQAPKGILVDHINCNGLDNRRINLRLCTATQNLANSRKGKGTSKYKGVYWPKKGNKCIAQVFCKGERHYLGLYGSEFEAARAYDRKAKELFGEFARTNF